MNARRSGLRLFLGLTLACSFVFVCSAQAKGQNQQNGQGGIRIDAEGVVRPVFAKKVSPKLARARLEAAARKNLPADVNQPSPLRKVSLVRLEAAFRKTGTAIAAAPEEMQYLAGLQRIDYLFVYPETGDIVIAGPAEGFAPDAVGRVVGVTSGRPPLRLDDLVVALRAVRAGRTITCSIDPTQENLAALRRYLSRNSNPTTTAIAKRRFVEMARILGLQDVTLRGVPPDSHYAQVLVEADMRMKRISMGLENPAVPGLVSHLKLIKPGGNSLQRWWFMPLYDPFLRSEDGLTYAFSGPRAQLMAQDEYLSASGQRSDAPFTRITTRQFAKIFTDKFPELAEASPVFAELQNLIDLAVMAALLKQNRLPERVGWEMSVFLDPAQAEIPTGIVPKKVPSAANYRMSGRRLVLGLVGGGVHINADATVQRLRFTSEGLERVTGIREAADPASTKADPRWWWD